MNNFGLKFYTTALLAALLFASCKGIDCVSGSGNQVKIARDIGTFTKIETSGSFEIILNQVL